MKELDLVKEGLARLPTRIEVRRLALGCLATVAVALLLITRGGRRSEIIAKLATCGRSSRPLLRMPGSAGGPRL
jgi:hypothetical protein